jgi:hypothetical protein
MNKYEITAGLNYLKESTLNEFNPYNEKGERWDDDPEPDKYDASNAKLVTKDEQEVILPYETVDFRGDPMTVIGFTPPREKSSTGRIQTDNNMSYFPTVAGLKIVGVIFSDGSVRESTEDDDLRDEESGKNHDPKTGKRTKPHPFDPGEEELHEGKMKDIISDAHDMSKEEFYKKYPHGEFDYDEILADYPLDEADGSGSYGGQSPLTYDTQRSSKMKEEDDELNEITKLSGLGEARKKRPDAYDDDDWDDEDEDEKPEDPDADKVPHILMQIKKALDVDGDYDIKFKNGDKHKFPVTDLNMFHSKYMSMKPETREKMNAVALLSKDEFKGILIMISPKGELLPDSLYDRASRSRYEK